ncbi:MAG: glutaminase domain-containing protein [Bryobacteraceae bacterium]
MRLRHGAFFAVGALLLCSIGSPAADFRPPAVPLVVHDPYFSVWSMADKLTDQRTKHWTGSAQSLCSLVRVDGTTYRIMGSDPRNTPALPQTKLEVLPTHTRYEFQGAGVRFSLAFLNPSLPDSMEMVSRPVTYITWSAQSADGKTHAVQVYFDASYELAVNVPEQAVTWGRFHYQDLQVLRLGSQEQPVLRKSGDNLRIDWGYLYVVAPAGSSSSEAATGHSEAVKQFSSAGRLPNSDNLAPHQPYGQPTPVLAETFDFGAVGSSAVSRHLVLAYDDIFGVDYFHRHLLPYWRRDGKEVGELMTAALSDYDSLEKRSSDFDRQLMADLTKVGGQEYAQLCALAFPQTIAAHKLVVDMDGSPLYFSKENFSNGSIDTVDVTYPSSPFFLLFNPRLLEAQLKPVLDYANLPRWKFPFAPHDLGRYPLANGQQYGGGEKTEEDQMPVEESGNMLLMIAGLAQVNGNASFAKEYWPVLYKWAEFLRAKGLDPENQLSTDDFAGHLAHNANLSAKAILAMGAFGKLAGQLGHADLQQQYSALARDYVQRWEKMGLEGNHFRLAFDRPGTWSQKYNLVWDKLLGLNLFPKTITDRELAFYASHANRYGLPLDNRADYTKIDWLAWTASLSGSPAAFAQIFAPAYLFAQESPSRVPLTDWYDSKTGKQSGFQARSVVGGIFIQMLSDPEIWKRYSQSHKD